MACPALVHPWIGCWLAAAAFLTLASGAEAQPRTSVVEGTVVDLSGAAIADAVISIRNGDTSQVRVTATGREGSFRIPATPVGTYEVRVESSGFAPYMHSGITLSIGQTAHLAIVLVPAGVVETVAVSGQPPPLDPAQTSVVTTVDTERIEELPVRSRNYLEFVLLAPGVARTPATAQGSGASSALPDSGFSFGGLRPRSNKLSIDGLDNNDDFSGASRTELSLEIVREFQVVNQGWAAENGGASGGAINVVTKSGANIRHGDAFLFALSGIVNTRPKLAETAGTKRSLQRYRAGLAAGGPISADRMFYYAAAEREDGPAQAGSDVGPSAAAAINQALATGILPQVHTRALTTGVFATRRNETEGSAKLSRQLDASGTLVGRIAGSDSTDENDAFNAGGLTDASARGTRATRDIAGTGSWTSVIGAQATNEIRAQLATRRLRLRTAESTGAGVAISGVAEFGTPYVGNDTHTQVYAEAGDTFALSRGAHLVKAGADVKRVGLRGTVSDGVQGLYVFHSLPAFLAGTPDQFRRMSSAADVAMGLTIAGAFLQDRWAPSATITVDAGVRFDAAILRPSLGVTDRQVSPRLGVSWLLAPAWVVRGGAGTFADRVVLASVERAWLSARRDITEQITDASSTGAPSTYTVQRGRWIQLRLDTLVGQVLAP